MPLHVSSTCAQHQEVKIALHGLWYHHTYRYENRRKETTWKTDSEMEDYYIGTQILKKWDGVEWINLAHYMNTWRELVN